MSTSQVRSEFDRALDLEETGTPGSWAAELSEKWLIGHAINGGMQLALAGAALSRELDRAGHPDPFAISAYYLSAGVPGPVQLRTEQLRHGRQVSSAAVSLTQPGRDGSPVERMRALATYGDLRSLNEEVATLAVPPQLPDPASCIRALDAPPEVTAGTAILHQLDLRIDPATAGWAMGKPSRRGQMRGWFRLPGGREPDPMLLLLAVDALPPVAFDLGASGWAPTLELTVHVRARPAPGWLTVASSSRNMAGGFLEEDAEVWDSAGRLVAQSRQLARIGD